MKTDALNIAVGCCNPLCPSAELQQFVPSLGAYVGLMLAATSWIVMNYQFLIHRPCPHLQHITPWSLTRVALHRPEYAGEKGLETEKSIEEETDGRRLAKCCLTESNRFASRVAARGVLLRRFLLIRSILNSLGTSSPWMRRHEATMFEICSELVLRFNTRFKLFAFVITPKQ